MAKVLTLKFGSEESPETIEVHFLNVGEVFPNFGGSKHPLVAGRDYATGVKHKHPTASIVTRRHSKMGVEDKEFDITDASFWQWIARVINANAGVNADATHTESENRTARALCSIVRLANTTEEVAMGYSCTTAADMTLREISMLIGGESSNGMPDGGFFEVGREQRDGAITGTVWRAYGEGERVTHYKRGSFRIEPNGKVKRFPGLDIKLVRRAEKRAGVLYRLRFAPRQDWKAQRDAILAALDDGVPADELWDNLQAAAGAYQRANGTMFLVLPAVDAAAIRSFLNGMN